MGLFNILFQDKIRHLLAAETDPIFDKKIT